MALTDAQMDRQLAAKASGTTAPAPAVTPKTAAPAAKATPVTLAQAKSLGFNSTKGITIQNGQYVFDQSLAPDRSGFTSVGVAQPGQVQMTPYYGDVTGSYMLTQEQYAAAGMTNGVMNTAALAKAMQENEIKALVAAGSSLESATAKVSKQYGQYGVPLIAKGGYSVSGTPTPGGQYDSSGNFVGGTSGTGGSTPSGSATGSASDGTIPGQPTAAQTATRTAATTAIEDFRANLRLAGLGTLADKIDEYIKQDLTASQIKINLVGTDEYKTRFPGMATLAKAGKAMNEATYISTEKAYDTVLRAHGLDTSVFGTTAKFGTYIASQVSPIEFETRVGIAADRVNKNSDVVAALNNYYGVSKSGAISYLLDPTIGLDIVQKEARAAEIGAAAAATNFSFGEGQVGAGVAESFINASGTQDLTSLKTEFGKARNMANVQSSLASIEGTGYSDLNAVTAVLGQDQQLLLESQRRAAREASRFSGSAGISTGSLKTESSI
jgi:hypothetical protein